MPSEPEKEEKIVLGEEDLIGFQANFNFSPKNHGPYTRSNLEVDDPLPNSPSTSNGNIPPSQSTEPFHLESKDSTIKVLEDKATVG